ncbi:MAG: 1-acyl-sn-glycerol-3-phosphate acyltransferase [Nocardioides sp.]|nr:1-acyl-sn-glycerol-3-phosphate acyltransferase [Nocardioides sp.]
MSDRIHGAVNLLGRGLLRTLDVRVHVRGAEHVPRTGPVLLASTHVSYPDFIFVQKGAVTRRPDVRFMCRRDVWDHPWAGWLMDQMQHIPVDRMAPAGAYLKAHSLLRAGEAVCAFPEAGISYSYTVRSLMRGVASLARELDVPVVPVALWGAQRIYSVGRAVNGASPPLDWTRGRRVDVSFGTPIHAAPDVDLTEWTVSLGHRLTGMLEQLQRMPEHQPRPTEYAAYHPAHLGGHAPTRAEARTLDQMPRSAVRPTWGPL